MKRTISKDKSGIKRNENVQLDGQSHGVGIKRNSS